MHGCKLQGGREEGASSPSSSPLELSNALTRSVVIKGSQAALSENVEEGAFSPSSAPLELCNALTRSGIMEVEQKGMRYEVGGTTLDEMQHATSTVSSQSSMDESEDMGDEGNDDDLPVELSLEDSDNLAEAFIYRELHSRGELGILCRSFSSFAYAEGSAIVAQQANHEGSPHGYGTPRRL